MRHVLLFAWLVALVSGPVIGLIVGPRVRRRLSRRTILLITSAAGAAVFLAFTPISLAGILADHGVLAAAYFWGWVLVGMLRSRILRGVIVAVPTAVAVWLVAGPPVFFLPIALGDLTALLLRTLSIECGWTTRTARVQPFGWVASSGYELTLSIRPRGVPIEVERGRRRFNDAEYEVVDQFSMRLTDPVDCTTVIAYAGTDAWRVP